MRVGFYEPNCLKVGPDSIRPLSSAVFVFYNKFDILHRTDDPILDALSPESTVSGAFKVVSGRLAEGAFHAPFPVPAT